MRHIWVTAILITALSCPAAHAFPARFGLSPDNGQELLLDTLASAQKTLVINIYQFDNPKLVNAVIERIRAGVSTKILVEGEPLGRISPEGRSALKRIRKAMKDSTNTKNRLLIMTAPAKQRRYRYNHAKYVVADSRRVLIGSENFTLHGYPSSGDLGNRGWMTSLENQDLAAQLISIFKVDSSQKFGDVKEYPCEIPARRDESDEEPSDESHQPVPRLLPSIPSSSGEVADAKIVTSPDALQPLLDLLHSATTEIVMEQMSLPSQWRDENNRKVQSPLVGALISAARKGVKVRVLLNDEDAFSGFPQPAEKKPNLLTARLLEERGICEKLPLTARVIDTRAVDLTYIHNKGIVVDGRRTLVSSINGTKNSIVNNREVAVQLESVDAGRYFEKAFDFDWEQSPSLNHAPTSETCFSYWNEKLDLLDWLFSPAGAIR